MRNDIALKQVSLFLLLVLGSFTANAQLKYGFKTGLNFAHMTGPSEINDQGLDLETWKNTTGFHIGMTVSYKFTDNFGLRGELLYSKRGAKYTFDGQSYRFFQHTTGNVLTLGSSRYLININNSYIDLPIMAYARVGDFEIYGGGYAGILIQSSGEGSLRYSGKNSNMVEVYDKSNNNKDLSFNLSYNYRKDDPGKGAIEGETPVTVQVGALVSETPKTLGAYYDYPNGSARLYNSLDFGVIGGLSYYISHALYLTARIQYGLSDLTKNSGDLSKSKVGANNELIFRDDKDKNFMIQASVGFSF